jgi:RimJ/RimL family protein N-acetyltransferase
MSSEVSEIVLKEFQPEFLDDLHAIRSHAETQSLLLSPNIDETLEQTTAWVQNRLNEPTTVFWIAVAANSEEFIGFVQFVDVHRVHRRCELGIALAAKARGRGYGRMILQAAILQMMIQHNIEKYSVHVRSDHHQAIRLYETMQFETVGTLRRHYRVHSEWRDVVLMELIR